MRCTGVSTSQVLNAGTWCVLRGYESNKSRPGRIAFDSRFALRRGGMIRARTRKIHTVGGGCLFREDVGRKQAVKSDGWEDGMRARARGWEGSDTVGQGVSLGLGSGGELGGRWLSFQAGGPYSEGLTVSGGMLSQAGRGRVW